MDLTILDQSGFGGEMSLVFTNSKILSTNSEVTPSKNKRKNLVPRKTKKEQGELILVMEPQNTSPTKYFDNEGLPLSGVATSFQTDEPKNTSATITIICHKCGRLFTTKIDFELHYRKSYNQEPIYMCLTCDKKILKYKAYRLHSYRHLNSVSERYKCSYCAKGFLQKSDLKSHESSMHEEKKITKTLKCKKCNEIFEDTISYKEHLKMHNNKATECPDCGKILMSSGSLYSHRKIHEENPKYSCNECDRKFVQKINFIHHLKKHLGDRPYSCTQCDKAFFEKSHLQRHQNFHSKARPFKCDHCGKAYKTERCLKVHSAVHLDQRPFVCAECNKGFLSSSKLKQHSNIHTGARPFKCKYCERDFTNFPNWLKHIRRRHKVDHRTGEKLDSVPNFMTKGKNQTKVNKVKDEPFDPAMHRIEEDSIGKFILTNETSNIDLNLLSKEDLIQPLPDELDMIMHLPDELQLNSNTYDDELFKFKMEAREFDCDFSINTNDPSREDSLNLKTKTNPPRQIYDINSEMSIFPTISSICDEQQFQYINPNFIHTFNCNQPSSHQSDEVKLEF